MISTAIALASAYVRRRLRAEQHPADEGERRDADDGGDEPAGDPVGEPLDRRLRALRLARRARTICGSAVSRPTRSARITNEPVALSVAPMTRSPGRLVDRQRFAGEHRLVDRRRAVDDHAVDGTRSPGRTRTRSPTTTWSTGISRSPPSRRTRAVAGRRSSSALDARRRHGPWRGPRASDRAEQADDDGGRVEVGLVAQAGAHHRLGQQRRRPRSSRRRPSCPSRPACPCSPRRGGRRASPRPGSAGRRRTGRSWPAPGTSDSRPRAARAGRPARSMMAIIVRPIAVAAIAPRSSARCSAAATLSLSAAADSAPASTVRSGATS